MAVSQSVSLINVLSNQDTGDILASLLSVEDLVNLMATCRDNVGLIRDTIGSYLPSQLQVLWEEIQGNAGVMLDGRDFRPGLGCTAANASAIWHKFRYTLPSGPGRSESPRTLLWLLLDIKIHGPPAVLARYAGVDEPTFTTATNRVLIWLKALYNFVSNASGNTEEAKFERRLIGRNLNSHLVSLATLDVGIDGERYEVDAEARTVVSLSQPLNERSPSPTLWSRRRGGNFVRYCTTRCIISGEITSIDGPYPTNYRPSDIFQDRIYPRLAAANRAAANGALVSVEKALGGMEFDRPRTHFVTSPYKHPDPFLVSRILIHHEHFLHGIFEYNCMTRYERRLSCHKSYFKAAIYLAELDSSKKERELFADFTDGVTYVFV